MEIFKKEFPAGAAEFDIYCHSKSEAQNIDQRIFHPETKITLCNSASRWHFAPILLNLPPKKC